MKKGDFVEIDFVGKIVLTGEVFDLTSEEDAKKEGIHNPRHKYKPSLVIIGSNMAVTGMEKKLEGMETGQEKEFTLGPDEAFGQRNPKLIRIVPLSRFTKEKINPVPGMFVDIDGMQTKVLSVAGGRVRVDFNHPLAGKSLSYKVRIVGQITDALEKARSLLEYYGIKCEPRLDGDTLILESEKPMNEFLKKFAGESVMKHIPEIKNVVFSDKEAAPDKHEHKKPEQEKA
ncbi:MAG TPA: peptidylprolyl isomerase [archaeon]|jgi:FKBP-type peptidyl-prolyl cis-trans isomerase SlyD|nr:peptidylprolyl isomerase [archaeon]